MTGFTDKQSEAGFTLVEIMIALFILSVGIMGVTSMFITTIKANQFARNTTVGNRLAQNLLEQAKTQAVSSALNNMCINTGITNCTIIAPNTVQGAFQEVSGGVNVVMYSVVMSQTQNSPITGLDTVTVTVSWSDAYGPHQTRLITYVEQ